MASISKLEKNGTYLKVVWDDGEESKFNYMWLRDNCPTAHDKDSRHRMFDILKVSKDINPKKYTLNSNGNFGIIASTPTEKLHIDGNIYLTGSIKLPQGEITNDELNYLSNVQSDIQAQLNNKQNNPLI